MSNNTLGELGEFGIIERLQKVLSSADNVVEGIGDDCAVVRAGDRLLLLSCDAAVEGIHFDRAYATAKEIGWKAATAALSDIAAMGGKASFVLVTLAASEATEAAFVEALLGGIAEATDACGAIVVGGDTTSNPNGLMLDITVIGEVDPAGRYLLRRGASGGDVVAVTGFPGESAAGLDALQKRIDAPVLRAAHLHPNARLAAGQWLAQHASVHAMIDCSDGLAQDVGHIATASALGVDIDGAKLPVSAALRDYVASQDCPPEDFLLAGGEDYELIVAITHSDAEKLCADFQKVFDIPLTNIGTFSDAHRDILVDGQPPARTGYQHFRRSG